MTQCHFISEGWDCGRPSKERCECEVSAGIREMSGCFCIGHVHRPSPVDRIRLMNGKYEPIEDFDKRVEAIR